MRAVRCCRLRQAVDRKVHDTAKYTLAVVIVGLVVASAFR
jgi:hypothetical protein